MVDEVHRILREEGIQFLLQSQTHHVQGRSGDGVSLTVRMPSGEQKIEGSDILVAAGRVPDLPYPKLRDAILAHPTMAEGLGDLFANVPPRSGP
jgi:pyruvate/2-oxoglutarate dehydrogenase complex dihydrolipoamide dehydrogenase (E3) component